MPDEFTFRSAATDEVLEQRTLPEVAGRASRDLIERIAMKDLFYSFGRMHPGALTLHNYPRHLQNLAQEDGPSSTWQLLTSCEIENAGFHDITSSAGSFTNNPWRPLKS
jgi:hypothetical protein